MLQLVGIPEPRKRVDAYPHEFSGGMRQRAMIAMALINSPKLLIADEPTTALDVTVQAQILELIERLQAETGTAVIMITHDLGRRRGGDARDRRHVCGADHRARADRGAVLRPPAPVHVGPAALDPAARLAARRGARADRGPAAVADHAAERLRVPSALPVRARVAQAHRSELEPVEGQPEHEVACLLPAQVRADLWQHLAAGELPERARAAVPTGDPAE